MPLEPGQKLSHYRLVEKVGEGGMGVVWRARDEKLRRDVALKVLPPELAADPERRRRLIHEARAEAAVNHPNIATIHAIDEAGGQVFFAMELVQGRSLRAVLADRSVPLKETLRIAAEVAEGLASAHAARLIHRDLKPENVMMRPDGRVKILDFGLAKIQQEREARGDPSSQQAKTLTDELTQHGRVLGTVAYMSPEQARGESLDVRTDVFSFGSMLYEMAAGRHPFSSRSATDVLSAILRDRPPAPSLQRAGVPAELDRIIGKCLEKEPGDRYQHADELAVDLRKLQRVVEVDPSASATPSGGVLGLPGKARSRERSWRLPVAAASAALVVALVTLVVWQVISPTAPVADPRTLLILPLEVRGSLGEDSYAGLAVAEAIAVNLAQARDLKVMPVSESLQAPDGNPVIRARDAGAGLLLSGTLTRERDSLQANISIVDTTENRILWGTLEDAAHTDLTALAVELAGGAGRELGITLPRSYDYPLYLSGDPAMVSSPNAIAALTDWRNGDPRAARLAGERLVEEFPNEIAAHALHAFLVYFGSPEDREEHEKLVPSLERVDPDNPYSDVFRAFLAEDPEEQRRLALSLLARNDLRPGLRAWLLRSRLTQTAQVSLGWKALDVPHDEDMLPTPALTAVVADLEEAVRLDPGSPWGHLYLSWGLHRAGRVEEALGQARQARVLQPTFSVTHLSVGLILASLGRWEESIAFLETANELAREQAQQGFAALHALSLAKGGREEEARNEAARASTLTSTDFGAYSLARYWALAGDRARALQSLRNAVEHGFADTRITTDTEFAPLRGAPEFEAIVAEVRRRSEKAGGL